MSDRFQVDDIVVHFKREFADKQSNAYMYRILAFGRDTTTQRKVVVYQALYGSNEIWVRDYDEFVGEIDDATRARTGSSWKYRFELFLNPDHS